MITIINSNEELYDLFSNNSALKQYRQQYFHFKYPLVIFDGFSDIFKYKSNFSIFGHSNQILNIDESVSKGKGNNFKYLMFDNKTSIIKFYFKNIYEERFYGVSMHKLINKNAKIMLFVNALHDKNSNVSMLNNDVIHFILQFFGPFTMVHDCDKILFKNNI